MVYKITINPRHIYNIFLGIAMAVNYAIEGIILYAMYKVINYVSNNPENYGYLWLIVGGVVLLLIRMAVMTYLDDPHDTDARIRHYSWHWLQVWRTGATIRAYLDTKVVIEIKEPPKALEDKTEDYGDPW